MVDQDRLLSATAVREYIELCGLSGAVDWTEGAPMFWSDLHALAIAAQSPQTRSPTVARAQLKAFGFDQTKPMHRLLRHAIS